MIDPIIRGLSNQQYHRGEEERQYLSSSQLKWYSVSPRYAKYQLDNPTEDKSDALRFGSLFHSLMESAARHFDNGTQAIGGWMRSLAVFEPPVNENTGQPYGNTTKRYSEAYEAFLQAAEGKTVASQSEVDTALAMFQSLTDPGTATGRQVMKLLKWGEPEVSYFVEYEGCKFKFRPDLQTKGYKLIDWKTVSSNDLSERSINTQIAKYGYDISAAMYMFLYHEVTGVWPTFYWLFISKQPPYDAVLCDASEWTYKQDSGIISPQVGAIKFARLRDLHIKCTKENKWPGAEINIPEGYKGQRIMLPTPPPWEVSNAANILEQSYE